MAAERLSFSAPAKINLALHVLGRRENGYHDLDSLVVFVNLCDEITLSLAEGLDLTVSGPWASGVPADERNLVVKTALALREHAGDASLGADIFLTKIIPHAAGLGGGSADAAAVLKGLNAMWGLGLDGPTLEQIGLGLGADIPICLHSEPVRMQGVGEQITPVRLSLNGKPALLLVNPGVSISTKAVFSSLGGSFGAGMSPMPGDGWSSLAALTDYLLEHRNDLEEPALKLAPVIGIVLEQLRAQPDCQLARMSGSGATCFGLFPDERQAWKAMHDVKRTHPDWWFAQTSLDNFGTAIARQ